MTISLTTSQVEGAGSHTEQLPPWIDVQHGSVRIEGDAVERRPRYVHVSAERVIIGEQLDDVTDGMRRVGIPIAVSPRGVSHTLTNAFAPLTITILDGIVHLGAGDSVTATATPAGFVAAESTEFPWTPSLSDGDRRPDTGTLRTLLAESTDRQVRNVGGATTLMLSSGKDSVALALALADSGHTEVDAITYKAGPEDTEHEYAASLCRRLGISHTTVTLPRDGEPVRRALITYFEGAPLPSADLTTIPYTYLTQTHMSPGGGVMDGSGNDVYMGVTGRRVQRLKSTLRVRPRALSERVRRMLPLDSGLNYFTRSRVASLLALRMFRPHDLAAFYPDAVDTDDFWHRAGESTWADPVDFLTSTVGRHDHACRIGPKIHTAARVASLTAVLPWCDGPTADYYFNLPEPDRFDRSAHVNKVLLRRLLAEALDYDEEAVGAHYFAFDPARFIDAHRSFVRDEILSCSLWSPALEPMLDGWLDALGRRPLLSHALHGLFMVSGWHNHSKHLDR